MTVRSSEHAPPRHAHEREAPPSRMGDVAPSARRGARVAVWVGAIVLAMTAGAVAATSGPLALGVAAGVVVLVAWIRSNMAGEIIAAAYWITFAVYQTVLANAGIQFEGIFYPFYLAFLANILVNLARGRVRFQLWSAVLYGAFMVVVLASFIGFSEPVDFFVLQRVFAYTLGMLMALQVGSERGLAPVAVAAVISGSAISVWVIVSAIQSGFAYRASIQVDQNLTAFLVGLGIVTAAAVVLTNVTSRRRPWLTVALALAAATMVYAALLLASRGMFLAISMAIGVLLLRAVMADRRHVLTLAVAASLLGGLLLLPGGTSLLDRFDGDAVETGGRRTPLWTATWEAYARGDVPQLLFGHGFKSSELVMRTQFGILTSVHNAYLQLLYEIGLIGLGLFVGLHALLHRAAARVGSVYGSVAIGMLWLLLGANVTSDSPDGFAYWAALGYVAAVAAWAAAQPPSEATTLRAPA